MQSKIEKLVQELEKVKKELHDNFKGSELTSLILKDKKTLSLLDIKDKPNKERKKLFDRLCKKVDTLETKINKERKNAEENKNKIKI